MMMTLEIRPKMIMEAFKVTFHNAHKNTFTGRKGSDWRTCEAVKKRKRYKSISISFTK